MKAKAKKKGFKTFVMLKRAGNTKQQKSFTTLNLRKGWNNNRIAISKPIFKYILGLILRHDFSFKYFTLNLGLSVLGF